MQQRVKVISCNPNGTAQVSVVRQSACSGDCHKCAGCGSTKQTMLFTAHNAIGAKPGDAVVVESDTGTVLKGAMLLYVLPLITFLAGYIVGENLWGQGILVSIAGFVLGMAPIKFYDRHLAKKGTVYTIKAYAAKPPQPNFTEKGDNEVD
jgi:sigma-E factor negative regulatory protein RseC